MTCDETDTAQALQQQLAELTQQYKSLHRSVDAVHGAFDTERRRGHREHRAADLQQPEPR